MAFRGRIRLSQLIADVLTGALVRTAADTANPNTRAELGPDAADKVLRFYSDGNAFPADQNLPGYVRPVGGAHSQTLEISPQRTLGGLTPQSLLMRGASDAGTLDDLLQYAGLMWLSGRGLQVGSGAKIAQIDTGRFAGNTNASARVVVPHSLGVVPEVVLWTDEDANHPFTGRVNFGAKTATDFSVQFRNTTTDANAGAGVAVSGAWVAIDL